MAIRWRRAETDSTRNRVRWPFSPHGLPQVRPLALWPRSRLFLAGGPLLHPENVLVSWRRHILRAVPSATFNDRWHGSLIHPALDFSVTVREGKTSGSM